MFGIGISRNTNYDNLVGCPKSGHIYACKYTYGCLCTCTHYISKYVATQLYMQLSIQILLDIRMYVLSMHYKSTAPTLIQS